MQKQFVLDNTTDKIRVVELSWERIFLSLTIESDFEEEPVFKLRHVTRRRRRKKKGQKATGIFDIYKLGEIAITPDKKEGNRYYFTFNITAMDDNQFLENGKWQIQAVVGGEEYTCSVAYDLAYKLDNKSQIFSYGNDDGKYAYNVSFTTYSEDTKTLSLVINSHFMVENSTWKKRHYIREAQTVPGKFDRAYMATVVRMMKMYYKVAESISPKHGKNVLFMTETKPYLWGNLKYINDRMLERGLDKEFNITYSLRNAVGHNKSAFSWAKMITTIAKQDYIFVDDYVPVFGFISPSERTKLIQVWHAGEGFKAVGYCRFGKDGSPFPAKSCHKEYDHVVTGSERLAHVYGEVFGLPMDRFLPVGMARLDGFLNEDKIQAVRDDFYKQYPSLDGKKLILFAPTYRGTEQKVAYYDYDKLDLKEIYDFCGDEYVWAYKMHPFVEKKPDIPEEYKDRIIDLSKWENINDLYYVTEILITDYSSAYYEFALVEKPVIFFTYDRETYELTRGVHKSVKDTAPGKVCDTFEDMMKALRNKDYDYEKTEQFRKENFSNYDGNAADKIIDAILLRK